ncbi:MAG: hypothetical protein Q9197_002731 [Variospora fuerteventurae]
MATNIPSALKSADVARFAQRAGQLEKAKPAIAYWCNYWIVNQLISRGLHNIDDDCIRYTTELMDKLEKTKIEHGDDDTITDDVAAQVFVEQFALETLQRADNAMKANRASRQTADTLLAAAAFLELRQVWEKLDPETSSRVKYAKYHALRIAKAVKAGEDPNATNPVIEHDPAQQPPLNSDAMDSRWSNVMSQSATPYQPTVEEVPDEHMIDNHGARAANQSQGPSRSPYAATQPDPSAPTPSETTPTVGGIENYYHRPSAPDISPLKSPNRGRNGSIGGGYFPTDVDAHEQAATAQSPPDVSHPSPPIALPDTLSLPQPNAFHAPGAVDFSAASPRSLPPPRNDHDTVSSSSTSATPLGPQEPNVALRYPPPPATFGMSQPPTAPVHQAHRPAPTPSSHPVQQVQSSHVVNDEEAMAKAQKHARWAISALNFEDVNTAIKELRGALETLGAN